MCLSIKDRYATTDPGTATTLAYTTKTDNGSEPPVPRHRDRPERDANCKFHGGQMLTPARATHWRIVQVDSPAYSVVYQYYTDTSRT